MQRCALYFGSFNPLHIGHITIAKYTILNKQIDEFKFVLSPQNPIKKDCGNSEVRLNNLKTIVRDINNNSFNFTLDSFMFKSKQEELNVFNILSSNISSEKKIEISDIEFHLPKPLFTYNTLKALEEIHPLKEFIIIMGADNLDIIDRWYKGCEILKEYEIWVYPRDGYNTLELCKKYGATYLDAPQINISSTEIRNNDDLSIYGYTPSKTIL